MIETLRPPDAEAVQGACAAFVGKSILVVGDVMLDLYLNGTVGRISPEAPVPVVHLGEETRVLGGAANVARCLVALGARCALLGVVGDDGAGRDLRAEAEALGLDTAGLAVDPTRPTTLKQRVVADRQQMIRLDRETTAPLESAVIEDLRGRLGPALDRADGVVLSDYGKGALTHTLCRDVIDGARARGLPVLVDPKDPPWDRYRGATWIKPNRVETERALGLALTGPEGALHAGARLAETLDLQAALVTLGAGGMLHVARAPAETEREDEPTGLHAAATAAEIFDPTGAGDVVAAVAILGLAAGLAPATTVALANLAAGIKVQHFGCVPVHDHQLLEAAAGLADPFAAKRMDLARARAWAAELRARGRSLVFTNGCFDILHLGHFRFLESARALGDALLVAINDDESVRRLKGPGRPLQSAATRARVLASQPQVDGVLIFSEPTPEAVIRALRPKVLCKGGAHRSAAEVVGAGLVGSWGGRVALLGDCAAPETPVSR